MRRNDSYGSLDGTVALSKMQMYGLLSSIENKGRDRTLLNCDI